jgi:hypothetical protein
LKALSCAWHYEISHVNQDSIHPRRNGVARTRHTGSLPHYEHMFTFKSRLLQLKRFILPYESRCTKGEWIATRAECLHAFSKCVLCTLLSLSSIGVDLLLREKHFPREAELLANCFMIAFCLTFDMTLKMEAEFSSETSVDFLLTTRRASKMIEVFIASAVITSNLTLHNCLNTSVVIADEI